MKDTYMKSLYKVDQDLSACPDELVETLATGKEGLLLERIVSFGHVTPEGEWYDQKRDEWVLVLEGSATLEYADGMQVVLERGEHHFIPRHRKHRVSRTSKPCIWLALHADEMLPVE